MRRGRVAVGGGVRRACGRVERDCRSRRGEDWGFGCLGFAACGRDVAWGFRVWGLWATDVAARRGVWVGRRGELGRLPGDLENRNFLR
jgi:hypothetical protein